MAKYRANSTDTWKTLRIKALDSMVIGSIIQFVGTTIPTGWLECDGSTITQSAYPELYDLIGGTLPDFRGRVLVGQDTSDTDFDTLLKAGGSKELQAHSHTLNQMVGFTEGSSNIKYTVSYGPTRANTGIATDTAGTGTSGNLQPYGVVKHIIKAKNTTPTMASIVNDYSESTIEGYSCDYVNDANSYLKEETDTGQTYYDGKKIYRKLLTGTSVSGSVVTLQAGLSNINTITKFYGVYGNDYPIPYATSNTSFIIEMYRNGQNINVVFGSSIQSNVAFRVIVEYTKN